MKFILTLALAILSLNTMAKEAITNFDVEVIINQNQTITVTENIEVISERRNIKRGIYRDLPLIRKSQSFGINSTAFKVIQVLRNDKTEPYHFKTLTNGVRVYIGHKDRYVKKGIHKYKITYLMSRHLFDVGHGEMELFWNITGDGWKFPILNSSVKFKLASQDTESLQFFKAYTGKYQSKEQNFEVVKDYETVELKTTVDLPPGHGWSVAVRFPKDQIFNMSSIALFKQDLEIQGLQQKVATLLLVLFALFALWYLKGVDPKRGTIIPLFDPPEDLSPAQINMAYLHRNHNDAMASAIMNLAVKGAIDIEEDAKITLRKKESADMSMLSAEESVLFDKLFAKDFITLSRTNRIVLKEAKDQFEKNLKEFGKKYYTSNWQYAILGILITSASLYTFTTEVGQFAVGAFIGFIEYVLIGYMATKAIVNRDTDSKLKGIMMIFPIGFMLVHGGMFAYAGIGLSKLYIGIFLLHAIPLGVFVAIIPSATKKGQRLIDKIEGFRHYLSIAEKDRLDKLNPPEMTPEIFEKYLPYAQALGEEGSWSLRFENEVTKSMKHSDRNYHPHWYSTNTSSSFNSSVLASSLGSSISSAMASSSSSSSSGSGGGGGGGGGGGW
jgi:uncharacterized membrane protein YgcG